MQTTSSLLPLCLLLVLPACKPPDPGPQPAPWTASQPRLKDHPAPRSWTWSRGIVHLHSVHSHDACDGDPQPGGDPNEPCLRDLKAGLCATAMDFAFVTDHPSHLAWSDYQGLLNLRENDRPLALDGSVVEVDQAIANSIACEDGSTTVYMPGVEDELMPVGLLEHVPGDIPTRDQTYNASDAAAVDQMLLAGSIVLQAHTEQRDLPLLLQRQQMGQRGVELFNLHAMVDPNIRPDFLGLGGLDWLDAITPFTDATGTAEPDLMFLGFYQQQDVSVQRWDGLNAVAPTLGVTGTDAHQNVFNWAMRDGERLDSYRRMMRWISNWLLTSGSTPEDYRDALQAGRNLVVAESLGTPTGFDFYLDDGDTVEMGGSGGSGTLHLTCPTLAEGSPRSVEEPEIRGVVYKDGVIWKEGCGEYAVGPGVYRAVIHIVPWHLDRFLGDDPSPYIHDFPWIYVNPIRVDGN